MFNSIIRKPSLGDINEMDAFILLCQRLPKRIKLLDESTVENRDKISKVWRDWRNSISHMGIQKNGTVFAISYKYNEQGNLNYSYKEIKEQLRSSQQFAIDNRGVYIDILTNRIEEINNWLCDQIRSKETDVINDIFNWLEIQIGDTFYTDFI